MVNLAEKGHIFIGVIDDTSGELRKGVCSQVTLRCTGVINNKISPVEKRQYLNSFIKRRRCNISILSDKLFW